MILYLAGIAVLLYIRPSFMFKGNGQWKEFAIRNGDSTTVFPFWMFCIAWAVISYFLVQVLGNYLTPSTALAFATASASAIASEEPEPRKQSKSKSNVATSTPYIRGLAKQEEELNEDAIMPLPSTQPKPTKKSKPVKEKVVEVMKPGYYKADPTSVNSKGVPRYIYMGEEAPATGGSLSDSSDSES